MSLTIDYLAIGDELLDGRVENSNLTRLIGFLAPLGLAVRRSLIVSDRPQDMQDAFGLCEKDTDVLIITGGLGPTEDDRTTRVLADYLGVELERSQQVIDDITRFFKARNRPVYDSNFKQADIPSACELMPNTIGTAPGYYGRYGERVIMVFPGVPSEFMSMLTSHFAEIICRYFPTLSLSPDTTTYTWETFGKGESQLMDQLSSFYPLPDGITLGFRAHFPGVQLRFTVQNNTQLWPDLSEKLQDTLKDSLVSTDGLSLVETVAAALKAQNLTISCAESLTAGLLSATLASVPGSSAYLNESYVTYSNESKQRLLDVSPETLKSEGAVSAQCAQEMAQGLYKKTNADLCIALTGVAGPTPDETNTNVGTVYIAIHHQEKTNIYHHNFQGPRQKIRTQSTHQALHEALKLLTP